MTDDYPRIAIRCKNRQCADRGRVLAEASSDGRRLYTFTRRDGGAFVGGCYLLARTTIYCPSCNARVVWVPYPLDSVPVAAFRVVT